MRWRPRRKAPADPSPAGQKPPVRPPLPENPYRRFYTQTPTFEELVRRTKGEAPDQKP